MDRHPLSGLLARDRRRPEAAVSDPGSGRSMSYHDFITTAYKAGNALRYLGVSRGALVAIDPDSPIDALLAFFGAAQLGATVRFVDLAGPDAFDTATFRVVLCPVEAEQSIDPEPGCRLVVYGGPPASASTAHWEEIVWSENPAFPDPESDPDTPILVDGDRRIDQGTLRAAARSTASTLPIDDESSVGIPGSLDDPRVLVGVLAALEVGGEAIIDPGANDASVDVVCPIEAIDL